MKEMSPVVFNYYNYVSILYMAFGLILISPVIPNDFRPALNLTLVLFCSVYFKAWMLFLVC